MGKEPRHQRLSAPLSRQGLAGQMRKLKSYTQFSAIADFLGMKHLAKLVLVAATLAFASCAHHDRATQTTQTTTSTGYRK